VVGIVAEAVVAETNVAETGFMQSRHGGPAAFGSGIVCRAMARSATFAGLSRG
jgi:hypothetical protein